MSESLKAFFGLDEIDFRIVGPAEFVHCVIDVQREFCDPDYFMKRGTREASVIAGNIASAADSFRLAQVPTILVYSSRFLMKGNHNDVYGGFHKLEIRDGDIVLPKNTPSVFESGDTAEVLEKLGAKMLLVSGFNANACVKDTVDHALARGYDVWLLEGCIGNDLWNERQQKRLLWLLTKWSGWGRGAKLFPWPCRKFRRAVRKAPDSFFAEESSEITVNHCPLS